MNWIILTSLAQLDDIQTAHEKVAVFKHSTRCPISGMAKRGLELDADLIPEGAKFYFLDVLEYRDVSNSISERWHVRHESPQLLILQGTDSLYHASHENIDMATACSFFA